MDCCGDICSTISRRKQLGSAEEAFETSLRRSLTTFQLTIMGIAAMIGAGLFVLTGVEAKEVTGPAIVVSYAIATVASILSALCYVEFACRIPKTGSAYTFTYIAIGEIWAFLIGWNLILEYAISAASVSSSFMGYLDFLTGYRITNFTVDTLMGGEVWDVSYLSPYPNIFASLLVILISLFIAAGANISAGVTVILMIINLSIIGVIVVMGFTKADIKNWQDYGGFVPNGPGSVIAGGATLFFSFVGFDTIAMANEETLNPRKSIPRATFIAILLTSVCYILASAALTLMVPYTDLDEQSAFAAAFQQRGIEWARWMVGVGALCAMFTTIIMSLYSLPRSIYAMASDGILFEFLSIVNQHTKVPVYAVMFSTILVIIPAMFFTLSQLVEFLSIGVLLGYSFVAVAVITLRYGPDDIMPDASAGLEMTSQENKNHSLTQTGNAKSFDDNSMLLDAASAYTPGTLKHQFRSTPFLRELCSFKPGVAVKIGLWSSVFFQLCALSLVEFGHAELATAKVWAILLLIFFCVCSLVGLIVISLHYQNVDTRDYYRVPFVPLFPWLAIFVNILLLLKLKPITWLRFLVWVVVGIFIYMTYGYRHSKAGRISPQRFGNDDLDAGNHGNGSTENAASYGSTD
ncbi:cationic amino acid transporter 4-like [Lytechinus variegatus]|uniref:cationic amino acid transporter 4-like n=1 Tax=Lytechinus variegatus TaxID=7654 RepID=UPI001BB20481|nr:cationic amino acid transporter 4-like [Lytechinus variegatus]XP_041480211.1 cationic amino acid transporter 4-like [Lytechinus variegatus]